MGRSRYRSDIPAAAVPRVVKRRSGRPGEHVEYLLDGEVVGYRLFFPTGEPELEVPLRGGKRHGTRYVWFEPGVLSSAEPYRDDVAHGTAHQWDHDGRLIGTYTLRNGTGWDLWRQPDDRGGAPLLSEAIHYRAGSPHGFEWWINDDQRSVFIERHHDRGRLHGIWREWNAVGRLSRGYPKYHVADRQVDKRTYVRALRTDPSLPPFRDADNRPRRTFPPAVERHLRRST